MPEAGGGEVAGAIVVPVLVGVVAVPVGGLLLGAVGVAGAAEPATLVVVGAPTGALSVPDPDVSEPHPTKANAISAQALKLRRSAWPDQKPFIWPLAVEFHRSKTISSLQGPARDKVNRLNRTSTMLLGQKRNCATKTGNGAARSHGNLLHVPGVLLAGSERKPSAKASAHRTTLPRQKCRIVQAEDELRDARRAPLLISQRSKLVPSAWFNAEYP